jgi:hypothetical protein
MQYILAQTQVKRCQTRGLVSYFGLREIMAASYLEKRLTFSPTRPSSPALSQKTQP